MKVIVTGNFRRDFRKIANKEVRHSLDEKIQQIEHAKDISKITGLKLLEGYSHHYRIKVKTGKQSYRIGTIIRRETIWLIRFLPRRIAYREFP